MVKRSVDLRDIKVGDKLPELVIENLSRTDFVRYAGASGDFNPIHHDETFAKNAGNPTVFAMGMLNAGFLSKCLSDYLGRQNIRRFRVRFATRVWPGDTITCGGAVTKVDDGKGKIAIEGTLQAVNQKGEVVLKGDFSAGD